MAKKIKKRTKKSPEEVELEAQQELRIEDVLDANDPAMEFGDPDSWENAGDDDVEVAPIAVDAEGQPLEEEAYELTAADRTEMAQARVLKWTEDNAKGIAAVLVIAAIAPIVVVVAMYFMEQSKISAASEATQIFPLYSKVVEGSLEDEGFDRLSSRNEGNFTKPKMYASEEAKWKAVKAQADKAQAAASSEGLKQTATLAQAAAALRLKDYDGAIKAYESVKQDPQSKALLPFVELGLAQAYAAKGDAAKAAEVYASMTTSNEAFAPLSIYYEARAQEDAKDLKAAAATYETLVTKHPTSPFKADAERRAAMIKASM